MTFRGAMIEHVEPAIGHRRRGHERQAEGKHAAVADQHRARRLTRRGAAVEPRPHGDRVAHGASPERREVGRPPHPVLGAFLRRGEGLGVHPDPGDDGDVVRAGRAVGPGDRHPRQVAVTGRAGDGDVGHGIEVPAVHADGAGPQVGGARRDDPEGDLVGRRSGAGQGGGDFAQRSVPADRDEAVDALAEQLAHLGGAG